MNIALLAWGSLLWDKGELALATGWERGGPELPLEFSRVSTSRNGALTLVIDPKHGTDISTFVAISHFQHLDHALSNLCRREGTSLESIGYVCCHCGKSRSNILSTASKRIADWAKKQTIDAVIWTDLPSNFDTIDKSAYSDIDDPALPFSMTNAQRYLHGLQAVGAAKAREYIKKAPSEVLTALRKRMQDDPWLEQ